MTGSRESPVLERILAAALALLFIMPLALTLLWNSAPHSGFSDWLSQNWMGRKGRLQGVTEPRAHVPVNWHSVITGALQKETALRFNESFAGCEALIRWTNELWLRLFHDTANASSTIAVGQNNDLYEKSYLREYFFNRIDKSDLVPWVKDLRRLQDFCREMGMGFVVLLTPGKASIYPEDIPLQWRGRYDPRPRACVLLTELFRENGIEFVDAIDLVAREKQKGPPAPLFPKGASHWNQRCALIAANAVQDRFAQQNKPVEKIESGETQVTNKPNWEECDLLRLMNLARWWNYPVEDIVIKPTDRPHAQKLTMAVIGDSFCWSLLRVFNDSAQFSDIDLYFHYRLYKSRFANGTSETVRTPAIPLDFGREVFAADCLLLTLNEETADYTENYVAAFVRDALAHLPDPAAVKPPFRAD